MDRYFRPFLRLAPAVGILTSLLALAPVELQMSAPFFRPLSATVYAAGGPVILDGTDAGFHGGVTNSAVWGQWIYVKKAYENLTAGVSSSYSSSSNGRIAVVGAPLSGSNTNNISNNCGGAAYWGATTMASPKGVDFYDGASAIETFFNDVQSGTVKPLLIHIVDGICNTNRMDGTEYTKVNAAANAIATHVNRGGALFANTGAYISGATNYGWLSTLFPTLSPNGDYGSNLQLTAAGQSAFPGLTNSNIAGAWHNGFVDSSGTYPLDVLATEGSGASLKRGILGGASVTLPSAVTITADSSSSTAGGTICFTVNVKRGNPLANFQGASVSFAVAGANAGASMATATTDASGNTPSRCYTGTNAGSDTVTATAVNPSAGNASLGEGVKNVTWTALSATATTATLGPNQNATVQGSATGTVYLVNTSVTVSNLSSITGAAGDLWNSVSISSANSNTSLALSGLSAGTYKAYLADGSGNLSPASSGTVTVDTTRPTVTITRAGSGAVGDGQTLAITFTLSSASSDFALGDIGVSGGTLSGFSGSGTTYTATWTPPANGSGVENIYVNAGGFTNSLGNTNTASSSLNIVWNANLPSVTITRAGSGTVGGGQDVTVTFTLSESSSNFVVGDITVSGGTLSGFASSNPLTYTATWTAPATGSGTASISVAANKFTNAAGNNNTASTALSIVWNTNLPSVTITRAGSGTVGGGQDITVTFELSEPSTNFALGDVTVSGGTLSGFAGSGTTYTATWTPPATGSGTASISVAANKFTDSAGNNNTASSTLSLVWNANLPSVEITRAGTGAIGIGQNVTLTFTLSEASTNFVVGDITVSAGTLSNFSGSGTSYSATWTPPDNAAGTATISVAAGRFTDATGNNNTASVALSVEYATALVTTTSLSQSAFTLAPPVSTPVFPKKNTAKKPTKQSPATTAAPVVTTTTTTIPVPVAPAAETGKAAATIGGEKVETSVARQDNSLLVTMGSLSALLSGFAVDGSKAPLDAEGNMRIGVNGRIGLEVNGFKSLSTVEAWLFSDPTKLGETKTSSAGYAESMFQVPAIVNEGRHRAVISGLSAEGKKVTVSVGIIVGEDDAGGGAPWSIILIVVLALALLAGLILPGTLRTLGVDASRLRVTKRGPRTVMVIDVRSASEFAAGHLHDAVNIPYESADFVARISELPKDGTYEVYGPDGMRAATTMRSMGLDSARHLGEIAEAARATARRIVTE